MLAIALALSGSLTWGVADFLGGLKTRRLSVLVVLGVSQGIGLALIAVVVLASGEPLPSRGVVALAALAAAAGIVGLGAYYQGLAVGAMSIVAPVSATAPVIPVAVGVAGGERPSTLQALGLALAVAGVVAASREPQGGRGGSRVARGVGLALVAAVGFGCLFVGLDAATEEGNVVWAVLVTRATALVLVGCALALARPSLAVTRFDIPALAAIGVLDMSAFGLFSLASSAGLLSVVSVLNSLYPVVTILLARTVLNERISRVQAAAIAVVFAGVTLIVAG